MPEAKVIPCAMFPTQDRLEVLSTAEGILLTAVRGDDRISVLLDADGVAALGPSVVAVLKETEAKRRQAVRA